MSAEATDSFFGETYELDESLARTMLWRLAVDRSPKRNDGMLLQHCLALPIPSNPD